MAIGVFGLQVAYKLKRLEVMSTDDTHGWFGGGANLATPTYYSTVDRVDFSNDTGTANIRGSLSSPAGRWILAATGNSNYGWFGGGQNASVNVTTVDRIDFSNDSATASPRGPLTSAIFSTAATANSNYGWFAGTGADIGVNRIDFSNDSATPSPRGPLSLARIYLAATGNSNYGWFGGGVIPTPAGVSTVDRIDFSNDSATASPRGPLSLERSSLAATGNSNYGWFGGGTVPGPPVYSTVDRIDFSNDTGTAVARGPLSLARYRSSATGNSNYGWFGGGFTLTPAYHSTVDRIDFSNDSVSASPRGPLSLGRTGSAATSGQAKGPAIKLQKAGNYGWFGGGITVPAPINYTASIDRINFSNDSTTATPRSFLSLARGFMGVTGNSNYGWFGGGFNGGVPAHYSRIDRIDFSNDSVDASSRGPLRLTRTALAATGNSNYGWFGGGSSPSTPTRLSTVERIDFSNDSATASSRTLLNAPSGRDYLAATGNSNYGWFGGGATPTTVATVDRIDFSNDSTTASPRGPLFTARSQLAATGNSNYGWFGGGSPGPLATVDRIDFSNDSVGALIRGPLTRTRDRPGATGNSDYGWFGGGSASPPVSSVDRINFSNDSVTASLRGSFSASPGRDGPGATSNTPT